MASLYPGGFDNVFAAIQATDPENTSGEEHDVMHNKLADAVNALEAHLGTTSDTNATSIDYLIRNTTNGHHHDGVDSKIVIRKGAAPTYTIFGDTAGYYIRNEQTGLQQFTTADTTDISGIFNQASAALGTGNLFTNGGGIVFSSPVGLSGTYSTKAPLNVYTNQKVYSDGWGTTIKAVTGFPTTGTETAPQPVFNAYGADRILLQDLAIDCNSIAGSTGVLTLRSTGTNTGGQFSRSLLNNLDIQNFQSCGIQNGKSADTGSTSNIWVENCHIYNGPVASKCFATYVGDVHLLEGNNFRTSLGFVVWISGSTVRIVGESHYGKITGAFNTNTNANIHIESGASVAIIGAYLDNVRDGAAVYSKAIRCSVIDCHVNGDGAMTDNTSDVFKTDGNDFFLANCDATGVDTTHEFRALLAITGTLSGVRVYGNRLTFGHGLWNGTAPTQHGGNIVLDNATWKSDQEPLPLRTNAPVDSDYANAQDGYQAYDTTNNRFYVRNGGTWKYVELS